MRIDEALRNAYQKLYNAHIKNPHLEAELLLSHVLQKPREYILSHPEEKINNLKNLNYKLLISKRLSEIPLSYITNSKSFYGYDFFVNKNVLIPRPETELMVDEVQQTLRHGSGQTTIIDIGTGSGCVIIAIAKKFTKELSSNALELSSFVNFFAIDISPQALYVAKKNAKLLGVNNKIKFYQGNLLEPIIKNPKNLKNLKDPNNHTIITANLPYLTPTQVKNAKSIQSEPKLALVAGADGLKYYQELFKQIKATRYPLPATKLFLEIDPTQKASIARLIKQDFPNKNFQIKKDLKGHSRLVILKI